MNEPKIAQLAESIKTLRWDIGLTSDQFFKLAYTNILTATLSLKNHTWFKVKENCCTKDTAIKKLELLKKQGYTLMFLHPHFTIHQYVYINLGTTGLFICQILFHLPNSVFSQPALLCKYSNNLTSV